MTAEFSIDTLLVATVACGASDLHLTSGTPPVVRVKGHLAPLDGFPKLEPDGIRELVYRILTTEQQKRLELERQLDFSHSVSKLSRFRVNAFLQRDTFAAVFRVVPNELKTLEEARPSVEPSPVRGASSRARPGHRPHRSQVSRPPSRR